MADFLNVDGKAQGTCDPIFVTDLWLKAIAFSKQPTQNSRSWRQNLAVIAGKPSASRCTLMGHRREQG